MAINLEKMKERSEVPVPTIEELQNILLEKFREFSAAQNMLENEIVTLAPEEKQALKNELLDVDVIKGREAAIEAWQKEHGRLN